MTTTGPLVELRAMLHERHRRPLGRPSEHERVALLGADVPRAVVAAAGGRPSRVFPCLVRSGASNRAAESEARSILGPGSSASLATLAAEAVDPSCAVPLVIDHSSDRHVRFHQAVEWMRARHWVGAGPPMWFVDLLHGQSPAVGASRATQRADLGAALAGYFASSISAGALEDARRDEDHRRELVRAVLAHRRADPPRLSGSDAITVVRASESVDSASTRALLERVAVDTATSPPVPDAIRAFAVGPAPVSYASLEADGILVVGEDHDDGELMVGPLRSDEMRSLRRANPVRRVEVIERAAVEARATALVIDVSDSATDWIEPDLGRVAAARGWEIIRRTSDPAS